MSKTYAVASAKGGVGKTTTVANLGVALASAGADVVVVDADIGMANLGGALGVAPDGPTLHTVLTGDADVAAATYEGPAGVAVVPGSTSLQDYRDADPAKLGELVDDLAEDYEYVLLDTGAGLSHDAVLPLGLADEVLLVSTAQREALGDTDKSRELVGRLDGSVAGLVLTRTDDADESGEPVDAEVLERVPDDPTVDEAITAGEPIVRYDPTSPAAAAYRRLATALTDLEIPDEGTEASTDEEGIAEDAEATDESEEAEEAEGDDDADADHDGKMAPDGAAASADADEESDADDGAASDRSGEAESEPDDNDEAESNDGDEAGADDNDEADDATDEEADDDHTDTADGEEPESDDDEEVDDEEVDDDPVIEEAEPRKSVGPRRDKHVPVRDDEELEDSADSGSASTDEDDREKKGFLSRLLGR